MQDTPPTPTLGYLTNVRTKRLIFGSETSHLTMVVSPSDFTTTGASLEVSVGYFSPEEFLQDAAADVIFNLALSCECFGGFFCSEFHRFVVCAESKAVAAQWAKHKHQYAWKYNFMNTSNFIQVFHTILNSPYILWAFETENITLRMYFMNIRTPKKNEFILRLSIIIVPFRLGDGAKCWNEQPICLAGSTEQWFNLLFYPPCRTKPVVCRRKSTLSVATRTE